MAFVAIGGIASDAVADELESFGVCTDARVHVEGHPDERWSSAIAASCRQLAAAPDRDPTADVRLIPSESDILVEVTLRDGRSTIRRLRAPASLSTTLEALVVLPPVWTNPGPPPALPVATPVTPQAEPLNPSKIRPTEFGVEFGAAAVGRIAGAQGYLSVGPELQAFVLANQWLFGLSARWDVNQWKEGAASGFEMETVGVGVGVGRRFQFSRVDLDLGLAPSLVSETQTFESSAGEATSSATDVRFGAFGRLGLGHAKLRFVLTLDAELSPSRLRRSVTLDPALPSLPSWSAGLGIGIVWREP